MSIRESEIDLSTNDKERVLQDTSTSRKWEIVTQADPADGSLYKGATESTLLAVLAAIQSGGGGVTWPLQIDFLTVDPAPVAGKILFYALSDGNVSPDNNVSVMLKLPDGTPVTIGAFTI